ncbi:MAG: hypothetical protein LPK09_12380, partial [Hymenobacteraceae bacterium]|nr:hypothetical protein [Hymenobacteraceae bacterium]
GINESEWAAIDSDSDGFIEMIELDRGILEVGWYDAWDLDKDNLLTDLEYINGVYNLWDTNGDNMLDETEYSLFDYYYLGRQDMY